MNIKARPDWTPADLLSVARLVVNPGTNGGTALPLAPEEVAAALPDAPAVAVFDGGRAAFVVGLNPYDPAIPRGILHVAGDGTVPDAWKVVRAFLAGLQGVEVLTFTANPALARLAGRAGLRVLGEQDGYLILGR